GGAGPGRAAPYASRPAEGTGGRSERRDPRTPSRRPASGEVGEGVVGDLPEMIVRIGEVARIAAPGSLGRRLDRPRPGRQRLGEDSIDPLARRLVVRERDRPEPLPVRRDACVLGQRLARKEREPGAFERKERDALLGLVVANRQLEPVAVEG